MSRTNRYRSRFFLRDFGEFVRTRNQVTNNMSRQSADRIPREFVYTSKATMDTVAGTPMYPMREGSIIAVQFSVTAAPSSAACVLDLLNNGVSVFDPASVHPQIPVGALISERISVDSDKFSAGATFSAGSKLQCQFTAVGGATGPAVVHIEYATEF